MKAVRWKEVYGGKDFWKRYVLSFEWKRVGMMDNDSGDDGTDELRQFVEKSEKKRLTE